MWVCVWGGVDEWVVDEWVVDEWVVDEWVVGGGWVGVDTVHICVFPKQPL